MLTARSGYARDNRVFRYRKMTVSEAQSLQWGCDLHALAHNGVIRRVRLNGAVKTWKRDTSRVSVPLKYGMYEAFRDEPEYAGAETMRHLIVLLDGNGTPTSNENAAEVS